MKKLFLVLLPLLLAGCNLNSSEHSRMPWHSGGHLYADGMSTVFIQGSPYQGPNWTYKQQHGMEMERRNLLLSKQKTNYYVLQQQKLQELSLAHIDADIRETKAVAAARINSLIENSIKDKSLLKNWKPDISDAGKFVEPEEKTTATSGVICDNCWTFRNCPTNVRSDNPGVICYHQ